MTTLLVIGMFATVFAVFLTGFPVAFALAGVSLLYAGFALVFNQFDPVFLNFLPNRIFGVMTNQVLIAVPMFIFMGMVLERTRIAEDLLRSMAALFGTHARGMGIAVFIVGALLAASTGIVGATVVAMGTLALPTMLSRGMEPGHACGSICAAGTLGQIIPPSIVLVVLADQISNAYQEAQREIGSLAVEPVSVGDLFAGALIPGLLLVLLYILYQFFFTPAARRPDTPPEASDLDISAPPIWTALVAPLLLMFAVLGSILFGIATPTEAAAVGAIGAILLGGIRTNGSHRPIIVFALFGLLFLLLAAQWPDKASITIEPAGLFSATTILFMLSIGATLLVGVGLAIALRHLTKGAVLQDIARQTASVTAMIFAIVIAAQVFALVFRGIGGDAVIENLFQALPGGVFGAMLFVMVVIFILGFFLEFIEIVFVVIPIVAPILLQMELNPIWLGVMIALNLQTSFLTPPFGFALFYLRGVAPKTIATRTIYKGVLPFIALQLAALIFLATFPELATWLPKVIFSN